MKQLDRSRWAEIERLQGTVQNLEARIAQLDQEIIMDKVGKRYNALLKVFDQWQITWKNENENLKNLLFNDSGDNHNVLITSPSILTLESVKLIVEEWLNEHENKSNHDGNVKSTFHW